MTSSTLLADPPSNETIDVFYINMSLRFLNTAPPGYPVETVARLRSGLARQRDQILGRGTRFITSQIRPEGRWGLRSPLFDS